AAIPTPFSKMSSARKHRSYGPTSGPRRPRDRSLRTPPGTEELAGPLKLAARHDGSHGLRAGIAGEGARPHRDLVAPTVLVVAARPVQGQRERVASIRL